MDHANSNQNSNLMEHLVADDLPTFTSLRELKVGLQVVALFTFKATKKEDLPMDEGDVLKIVQLLQDQNWLIVENSNGRQGVVPENYIGILEEEVLARHQWYHGKINRTDTERRLGKVGLDGAYLVRDSSNHPKDLTLCVLHNSKVNHYHVKKKFFINNKYLWYYTIDDDFRFYPLQLLVQHYETKADGLCCQLTMPVKSVNQQKQPGGMHYGDATKLELSDELIGKGEFSEVRKCKYEGRDAAVKCVKKGNPFLETEASLMKSLKGHKNLVQFLAYVLKDDFECLVMEFVKNGSLLNFLRSRGQSVIGLKDQLQFAIDTANGMEYLASKKIIHRDLAARNVLLDENCQAKVADFNLAKQINDQQQDQQPDKQEQIPLKWTAPECVQDHKKFSLKSDVWSFGILLWEIFSFGRMPYPRIKTDQVIKHVDKGYRMEPPENCPPEVYEVMRKCWHKDPSQRPNFKELKPQLAQLERLH